MDVAFVSHIASGHVRICNADAVTNAPIHVGDSFPAEDGYCQRIIDERIPYLIPDTANVPEVAKLTCTQAMPVGSHLSVPLRLSDGSVYGTFCCFSYVPNHTLNQRDLQMMLAFAELAAAQIEAQIRIEERARDVTARISRIIEQDDLTMAYQPIYQLNNNQVVGVESLARFPDSPSDWFAEAAEAGLGIELEMTAVRSALRGLRYLPRDIYLAVNVSPDAILSGAVERTLRDATPGRILLEVTEHAHVNDYSGLLQALKPLRGGVRIAVDDAGAGFSGLKHILEIEPDIIKLDLTLTRGIDQDPAREALATALVTFANKTGSQIVAEGIETAAELEVLRQLKVSFGQGYWLARPMPLSAAAQFLMAH